MSPISIQKTFGHIGLMLTDVSLPNRISRYAISVQDQSYIGVNDVDDAIYHD